jgi:hypothetical protein
MKIAHVEAMFPELKGRHIYRSGRGEGSNPKAAISRAMGDLFKSVKGKRFSTIKCTITITEKADADVQFIHDEDENVDENVRSQRVESQSKDGIGGY